MFSSFQAVWRPHRKSYTTVSGTVRWGILLSTLSDCAPQNPPLWRICVGHLTLPHKHGRAPLGSPPFSAGESDPPLWRICVGHLTLPHKHGRAPLSGSPPRTGYEFHVGNNGEANQSKYPMELPLTRQNLH